MWVKHINNETECKLKKRRRTHYEASHAKTIGVSWGVWNRALHSSKSPQYPLMLVSHGFWSVHKFAISWSVVLNSVVSGKSSGVGVSTLNSSNTLLNFFGVAWLQWRWMLVHLAFPRRIFLLVAGFFTATLSNGASLDHWLHNSWLWSSVHSLGWIR